MATIGLDKILSDIDKISRAEGIEDNINRAAALVERDAKMKCPVLDGTLRQSITSKIEKNGTKIEGIVYSPLQYAPYVEFGTGLFAANGNGRTNVPWFYVDAKGKWHITSGQKPQPFLIPALNENRSKILETLAGD